MTNKIRVGKYMVEEGKQYLDQDNERVSFEEVYGVLRGTIHDGSDTVFSLDATGYLDHLTLSVVIPLRPRWEPRVGQVVYVRDYDKEPYTCRYFCGMSREGEYICETFKGASITSTWKYCKPIPKEDIV